MYYLFATMGCVLDKGKFPDFFKNINLEGKNILFKIKTIYTLGSIYWANLKFTRRGRWSEGNVKFGRPLSPMDRRLGVSRTDTGDTQSE